MRLKEGFITHESADEYIIVAAGSTKFSGMVRSNKTAGFIVECLKNDVTKEEIVTKVLEQYDAPRAQVETDVDKILKQLGEIGALDD